MSNLVCSSLQRRELVQRNLRLNGLDYLEVSEDQRRLTVYFIDKTPISIGREQVKILGGRKTRNIQVTDLELHQSKQLERDDYMVVSVDKPGDFSSYTLKVEASPENALELGLDPYYSSLEFSFKANCPGDLDCRQNDYCPQPQRQQPQISYLAKDYASFRQLLLDRLALIMPDWQERHVPDIGITLVEILAYVGDHLSYYQDAVATEAYLDTARLRTSVRRHARLMDYLMHEGCNARAWLCVEVNTKLTLAPADSYFITRFEDQGQDYQPAFEAHELDDIAASRYRVFEPMGDCPLRFYPEHNEIHFHTWGQQECCLHQGATEATLVGELVSGCADEPSKKPAKQPPVQNPDYDDDTPADDQDPDQPADEIVQDTSPRLRLKPGDVLIFEEIIGPGTGNPADRDRSHRHAVCLTWVEAGFDSVTQTPVVHIRWARADALPFPLCLSVLGPAPECKLLEPVSVARGNVILVDHGRSREQDLGETPVEQSEECCIGEGIAGDAVIETKRFRPRIAEGPLTFYQPAAEKSSATELCTQDPRLAVPAIAINETAADDTKYHWQAQQDLLWSEADARQFVAEVDDAGQTEIRFGNGRLGMAPAAGSRFAADYRIGNGKSGNVGAESIIHLVTRKGSISGGLISIRNPLPAKGGIDPEPVSEVKLFAPKALRSDIQRAITAADYARIVEREFPDQVQRAAATLCWSGCGHRVLVAVDPLGQAEAEPELLTAVQRRLHRYRRIGHDISVQSACQAPLDLQLTVCVKPDYLRAHVKAALLELFSNRQLTDGRKGLFHPDNLSFGDDIYLSRLAAAAQRVAGVQHVAVTQLKRCFEAANGELEKGVLSLGPLEIARLDNDPGMPENGKLELVMGGGR